MEPTATGSKARWAPQAKRKACMGWSWAAARGIQGRGHIVLFHDAMQLSYDTRLPCVEWASREVAGSHGSCFARRSSRSYNHCLSFTSQSGAYLYVYWFSLVDEVCRRALNLCNRA